MKPIRTILAVLIVAVIALAPSAALWAENATIYGKINDYYQIEGDDGRIYEIGDTEEGQNALDHIGRHLQISGEVEEEDGDYVIYITAFSVLTQ